MNNTFFDENYQITFLIPFGRQLKTSEAQILARRIISSQKEELYQAWKARPENKDWSGNDEAKKEELFVKRHPPNSEMLIGDSVDGLALSQILKDADQ